MTKVKQTAKQIAQLTWKMNHLEPEETIDHCDQKEFELKVLEILHAKFNTNELEKLKQTAQTITKIKDTTTHDNQWEETTGELLIDVCQFILELAADT